MSDLIYLNNAATSYPKPPQVLDAVARSLICAPVTPNRTGFEQKGLDVVSNCRIRISGIFGIPNPDTVAFTSGATESINLALKGLPLRGKEVITTAMEHNSVLRPLKTLENEGMISLRIIDCDKTGVVHPRNIREAVTHHTGAVVVNHCSNVTGSLNDIQEIGAITKEHNVPFIVDASQSAGIYPINVLDMNIDILAFTAHKSLYGIQGTGGIYIRDRLHVSPLKTGGTGVRSSDLNQPNTRPLLYEAGTHNIPGITALYEGCGYVQKQGMTRIQQRKQDYVSEIRSFLSRYDNVILYPGKHYKIPTIMLSFSVKGMEVSDIGYLLENSYRILVRTGLHCSPLIHQCLGSGKSGTVRISPSYFSTETEISAFLTAMEQILKMAA